MGDWADEYLYKTCEHGKHILCFDCTLERVRNMDPETKAAAEAAVKRMDAEQKIYDAATPAERDRIDAERRQAGVDFIMDTRFGGP